MGLEVFRSFGRCLCFCWARFQTGIPPYGGMVAAVTIVRVAPPRHHQVKIKKLDRRSHLWGGGPTSKLLTARLHNLQLLVPSGARAVVLEPFALASRGGLEARLATANITNVGHCSGMVQDWTCGMLHMLYFHGLPL